MPIRVVIADSRPVVRAGLFSFFAHSNIEVVGETQTAKQTYWKTLEVLPDLLMLDAAFTDGSGFEVVAKLRKKEFDGRVVFFANENRLDFFARAIAAGADSYILKGTAKSEILRVIRELVRQKEPSEQEKSAPADASKRIETLGATAGELRKVAPHLRRRAVDPLSPLTEREAQVLRHIVLGLSNKEISASLQLSLDTIKEHVQNILRKLDVSDRTQAAVWAVRNKLAP